VNLYGVRDREEFEEGKRENSCLSLLVQDFGTRRVTCSSDLIMNRAGLTSLSANTKIGRYMLVPLAQPIGKIESIERDVVQLRLVRRNSIAPRFNYNAERARILI
jgi:hypothetical protein